MKHTLFIGLPTFRRYLKHYCFSFCWHTQRVRRYHS